MNHFFPDYPVVRHSATISPMTWDAPAGTGAGGTGAGGTGAGGTGAGVRPESTGPGR